MVLKSKALGMCHWTLDILILDPTADCYHDTIMEAMEGWGKSAIDMETAASVRTA